MNQNFLKHIRSFASVNWQTVNQICWSLCWTFTKDVKLCVQTLKVIGLVPSPWELHTFYLIQSDFSNENQEKPEWSISPPGKNSNRNQFVFLSSGVYPISWQSFIEIGEMACSTTARCSRGHSHSLLRNLNMPFSVTGVSETWLTDCNSEFVNTTGYHFVSSLCKS